jgi:serine/threonine protein kinase
MSDDAMIGQTINNYRILAPLGEGGMGAVYLAEHPFMGRKAAVKVLHAEFAQEQSVVERFMNEARAANAIHHPNIIDIIDVGRMPSGIPYLMMEFLEGVNLTARIAEVGRLSIAETIELGIQTTGALGAAHAKGIIHRDLKPDNIYVIPDPSNPIGARVKILDFGIAKLRADVSGGATKTQTGTRMGSPPYMSPEQWGGLPEEIDLRTDIYAMGCVLYEMLCGVPPFPSTSQKEIMFAHVTMPPPSPRTKNPQISPALESVILKALAKKREDRFPTMPAMQAALRTAQIPAGIAPVAATIAIVHPTDPVPPMPSVSPSPSQPDAPRRLTTLHEATGEVRVGDSTFQPPARPKKNKLWISVGTAIGVAAALAIVFVTQSGKGTALGTGLHSGKEGSSDTPRPPDPPPAAPVPVPAMIQLNLTSEPTSANVMNAASGATIGNTPFIRKLERASSPLELLVAKEGFATAKVEVPMGQDFQRNVVLEAVPRRPTGPPLGKHRGQPLHAAGHTPPVETPSSSGTVEKW